MKENPAHPPPPRPPPPQQDPSSVTFFTRLRRFYQRNDVLFWCAGLVVFSHVVWWQIQQNRAFVSRKDRVHKIGPFEIPYLDETEFYKKRGLVSSSQEPPK